MAFFGRKQRRKLQAEDRLVWNIAYQNTVPATSVVHGRRFYNDTPYTLPKDMQDVNRLDFQHFMLRQALQSNYLAPLNPEEVHTMLDVGCGTSRWGSEMARAFPRAQVLGYDLEEVTQTGLELPCNYHFLKGNIFDGLPFASATFEYIHQRLLVMGIPVTQWIAEIRELLRVTARGGYIELVESGNAFFPVGEYTRRWMDWGMEICQPRGLDPSAIANLADFARQAGMKDIQTCYCDIPVTTHDGKLSGWYARLGQMMLTDLKAIYESLTPLYISQLGLDEALVQAMPRLLEDEWNRLETKLRFYIVIGRK